MSNDRNFEAFCAAVREQLEEVAAGKGYSAAGTNGPNPLYEFVAETVGGPWHALGEVVYKMRRFARRRDEMDLVKAAAWVYLMWHFMELDSAPRMPWPPPGADAWFHVVPAGNPEQADGCR